MSVVPSDPLPPFFSIIEASEPYGFGEQVSSISLGEAMAICSLVLRPGRPAPLVKGGLRGNQQGGPTS